ncbi:serine hydrolase domain-containing protein [Mangrovihabitans endophyticus]|uniref:Esterase n=1 Tax=Mangrovihabitans endophyticus TaxID=1751298 RepID=A0A8J3BWV2_9ACTN|nr:serine hydrolase domain-containing protein [Mangrovihabitans endophyticus]GGK75535.1 esterase [Mangrovihabitans endophyticus]
MDVVERLIAERGATAQLCVLSDGETVCDEAFGTTPDVPFLLFSAGKPFLAVLVHRLAEQGRLALDDPIARHWPDFGRRGKHHITVRQVLQHRSGLPYAHSLARDALLAPDWRRSTRALAAAAPHFPPGSVPAYHVLSFGFLLGEVVQRVTGRELREVLREEIVEPAGLRHTALGAPRRIPLRGAGFGSAAVRQAVFNSRRFRTAVIPAATMSGTARDLARFYQALLDGRLLSRPGLAMACRPSSDGELDRVLGLPVRWSQGFQLGGAGGDPARPRPMGRRSSTRTFGHNGSNTCLGWADPDRRLVVAYLTNRLQGGLEGSPHLCAVSDAVREACA